jgi:hypothetical protein
MYPSRVNSFTPFIKVYGSEVGLPTDLDYERPGSRRTRSKEQRCPSKTQWTILTKCATLHYFDRPNTSKRCNGTTASECEVERSMSVTYCYDSSRATRTVTRSPHPGRGPIIAEVL